MIEQARSWKHKYARLSDWESCNADLCRYLSFSHAGVTSPGLPLSADIAKLRLPAFKQPAPLRLHITYFEHRMRKACMQEAILAGFICKENHLGLNVVVLLAAAMECSILEPIPACWSGLHRACNKQKHQ